MDARPAVMRQWPDRKAISQGAPQWAREQGGASNSHRTNARMWQSERTEWTDWAAPSSEEPEATRRPDWRRWNPWEGATTNPGREHPEKEREEVNQNSIHGENWKTQPPWEPQKFPRGTAPLDPTVIHRQNQRSKKSQLSDLDSAEATDLNRNRVIETHPTMGEKTITSRWPIRQPSHKEETNGKSGPGPRAILRHLSQA